MNESVITYKVESKYVRKNRRTHGLIVRYRMIPRYDLKIKSHHFILSCARHGTYSERVKNSVLVNRLMSHPELWCESCKNDIAGRKE